MIWLVDEPESRWVSAKAVLLTNWFQIDMSVFNIVSLRANLIPCSDFVWYMCDLSVPLAHAVVERVTHMQMDVSSSPTSIHYHKGLVLFLKCRINLSKKLKTRMDQSVHQHAGHFQGKLLLLLESLDLFSAIEKLQKKYTYMESTIINMQKTYSGSFHRIPWIAEWHYVDVFIIAFWCVAYHFFGLSVTTRENWRNLWITLKPYNLHAKCSLLIVRSYLLCYNLNVCNQIPLGAFITNNLIYMGWGANGWTRYKSKNRILCFKQYIQTL